MEKELITKLQTNLAVVVNQKDNTIEPYNEVIDEDKYSVAFTTTSENLINNVLETLNMYGKNVFILHFGDYYMGVIENE